MTQGSPVRPGDVAGIGKVLFTMLVGMLVLTILPVLFFLWSGQLSIRVARTQTAAIVRAIVLGVAGAALVAVGYKAETLSTYLFNPPPGPAENIYAAGIFLAGSLLAVAAVWIAFFATGGKRQDVAYSFANVWQFLTKKQGVKKAHVKGMRLLDLSNMEPPDWLQDGSEKPVALGWVPYDSIEAETLHTQIEGATGSGKTQAIKCLMAEAIERGDSVVCIDGGRDLWNTFKDHAGTVTRFDLMESGLSKWSPLHEIERPADWDQLATGIIGDGSGESAEWRSMAKALFSAVGEGYARACDEAGRPFSNREFGELLLAAPDSALAPFVVGTPAAALIGNDKGLSSVRMSLLSPLAFLKYLPELAISPTLGGFSARQWMRAAMKADAGQGALFITFQKRDLATARNLIAAMIDLLISAAVDEGKGAQRVWLIIDELAGLGEIPSLLMGAAELRKTGVRLVVGMQDYDQIENIYGRSRASSITNNLSNKLVLRTTSGTSAERLSRMLGETRVLVTNYSGSTSSAAGSLGATQKTSGTSTSEHDERVVMPAEILSLPDLIGFVKMAGEDFICKTPVPVFGGVNGSANAERKGLPSPSLIMRPSS